MIEILIDQKYRVYNSTSSKGMKEKYFYENKWYKVENNWYEELVTNLLTHSTYGNFVKHKTCRINGKLGCVSETFLAYEDQLWTVSKIYKYATGKENINDEIFRMSEVVDRVAYVVALIDNFTGLESFEYLKTICYLDALISNHDRHFNNIGFIYNNETGWREAPIYDNASCLDPERKEECANFCGSHIACMRAFDAGYQSPIRFEYDAIKKTCSHPVLLENMERYKTIFSQ